MKLQAALLSATLLAAALLPATASAASPGATSTYSNLNWTAAWAPTTSPYAGCTTLKLDSMGDLVNSNVLALNGSFVCAAVGNVAARTYGVVGTAYFSPDGQFNISLLMGNGVAVQCLRLGSTSGSCQVSDVAGATTATVQLTQR